MPLNPVQWNLNQFRYIVFIVIQFKIISILTHCMCVIQFSNMRDFSKDITIIYIKFNFIVVRKHIWMVWIFENLLTFVLWSNKDEHYVTLVDVLCLVTQLCLTLCLPMDCSLPGSSVHGDSPGKNAGVGCHALLQGIFPTQGSNPGLLHYRRILCHLSH